MGLVPPNRLQILDLLIHQYQSVQKACNVIQTALERYGDGSSEKGFTKMNSSIDLSRVLLAFNGGKDCTLLLELFILTISRLHRVISGRPRLLYIKDRVEETFPEVSDFMSTVCKKYDVDVLEVADGDMKAALQAAVSAHPEVRAVFMGTRATDPNAGWMDYFCKTSDGWPQIDIVAPILHMSYSEVWKVMDALNVEYCSLYKLGYTSIGSRSTTVPNPHLLVDGKYLHANQLEDESFERAGRTVNKKK